MQGIAQSICRKAHPSFPSRLMVCEMLGALDDAMTMSLIRTRSGRLRFSSRGATASRHGIPSPLMATTKVPPDQLPSRLDTLGWPGAAT